MKLRKCVTRIVSNGIIKIQNALLRSKFATATWESTECFRDESKNPVDERSGVVGIKAVYF